MLPGRPGLAYNPSAPAFGSANINSSPHVLAAEAKTERSPK